MDLGLKKEGKERDGEREKKQKVQSKAKGDDVMMKEMEKGGNVWQTQLGLVAPCHFFLRLVYRLGSCVFSSLRRQFEVSAAVKAGPPTDFVFTSVDLYDDSW